MSIFKKMHSMFSSESDTIRAAKRLPEAYIKSIGVNFMDIEDPNSDGDWLGLGDPLPLSSITDVNPDTGEFTFNYLIMTEDPDFQERFSTPMKVQKSDLGFTFSTACESVTVPHSYDSSMLQSVVTLAKKYSSKR